MLISDLVLIRLQTTMCCCIPQAGMCSEHKTVSYLRTLAASVGQKEDFIVRTDKLRPAPLTAYQMKIMSLKKKKDSYILD